VLICVTVATSRVEAMRGENCSVGNLVYMSKVVLTLRLSSKEAYQHAHLLVEYTRAEHKMLMKALLEM
jgi:hypothetical protein